MSVAVILPTRGLVFIEVEEAIQQNLRGYDYEVFRSFTLPIPECQNVLVQKALDAGAKYLWFVEEDTVPPERAFVEMVKVNADIACIDYAVQGTSCTARDKETDELLWCGLGCTLVKREVFEAMDKPYFRTDMSLRLNDWANKKNDWIPVPPHRQYGQQDVWFCRQAVEKGFAIVQVKGECRHLELVALGVREHNHGLHVIKEKRNIESQQFI
jgi:hypothetical protein